MWLMLISSVFRVYIHSGKIERREKKIYKRKKKKKERTILEHILRRQSETNPSISPRLRNGRVTSTRRDGVIGLIGDAGPIVEEDKQRQKTSTPVRPSMPRMTTQDLTPIREWQMRPRGASRSLWEQLPR